MKLTKYIKPLLGLVMLVVFDQWTKWLATAHLMDQAPIVLWDGVFELNYLENRGAAFGLFQDQKIFFIIVTVIIVAFLCWFYHRIPDGRRHFWMKLAVVVCLAGALGNFVDRMVNSYVVDFFYFKLIDFPIFNVADIYVTCSAVFFVILYIFYYKEADFDFLSKKAKSTVNGKDGGNSSNDGNKESNENEQINGK